MTPNDEEKVSLKDENHNETHAEEHSDVREILGFVHSAIVYPTAFFLSFHPPRLAKPFLTVAWLAMGGPRAQRRRERRMAERVAKT